MMSAFSRLVLKHPRSIAFFGTILGILASLFAVELYKNLRTELEELLPTDSRSVHDLKSLSDRFESFDNLVVLVFSKDVEKSREFVDALAKELANIPKDILSKVEFRADQEAQFFKARQGLFLDISDLERIRDHLRSRTPFDFRALEASKRSERGAVTNFRNGYYATSDETVRALLVYMPSPGLVPGHRLKNAVESTVARLKPQAFSPDIQVKYTGNLENVLEESSALAEDLAISTAVVTILVLLAMFLFFRSPWATLSLVVSLLMGTCWTFGVAYFLVGYLNGNTAFLASIVMGNGINFGIILLARYLEERRKGVPTAKAIESAMKHSAPPTATAAIAAGLSYGSLMLTSFRGFSQFGIIGLTGMILCWVSAYTLLPAYLIIVDSFVTKRLRARGTKKRGGMDHVAKLVDRFSVAICVLVVLASLLSVFAFRNWNAAMFESDFSKLRNKETMTHGSGALFHYLDDIFGHSTATVLVLPKDRNDVARIAQLIREEKAKLGKDSVITSVQTIDDFVARDQPQKISLLAQMPKGQLPFITPEALTPYTESALPPNILSRFTEKDGSRGKLIFVDKKVDRDKDDIYTLSKFIESVRDAADKVAPGTPVAGQLAVTYDMFDALTKDGPKVTILAFCLVVVLVILLFRNVKTIALALFALSLGVLWFAGLILGFRLKLNFLNFIALPITFGIGVDYGVNIFQRYREQGAGHILDVVRNSGGAVLLCSLTTIIGYSSLLMAGNRAFVSFGLLAVLGELTCVAAAVIALPAYLNWRRRRTVRK